MPLESAVAKVRDPIELLGVVLRGVQKSRRAVRREIAVHARVHCRAGAEIVHDCRVQMPILILVVGAPSIFACAFNGKHAPRAAMIESGDRVALLHLPTTSRRQPPGQSPDSD